MQSFRLALPLTVFAICLTGPSAHAALSCKLTYRITNEVTLAFLQFHSDYSAATGEFVGSGSGVSCTVLIDASLPAFNDVESQRRLNVGIVRLSEYSGPIDIVECTFRTPGTPDPAAFPVTVVDATDGDGGSVFPLPEISVGSVVCDEVQPVCGDGVVDVFCGETCDPGVDIEDDCCSPACIFEQAGTSCGNPVDNGCDFADVCDGAGLCLPNLKPDGSSCDNDICTIDECVEGFCDVVEAPTCPLLPVGIAEGDEFGAATALSSRHLVVGAPATGGAGAGRVHVFVASNGGYVETKQTTPIAVPFVDRDQINGEIDFGAAVDIHKDTVVVGAPHDVVATDAGQSSGSASVFVFDGTVWKLEAKLIDASGECGELGTDVAVSDDTIVLGAPAGDCALVFERAGTAWIRKARLDGPQPGARFGRAVDVSGKAVLVGAPGEATGSGCSSQGHVYAYQRGASTWEFENVIAQPTTDGGGTCFGVALALDAATGVVGAPNDDTAGANAGSVYVVEHDGDWQIDDQLLAPSPTANDLFGSSVDLEAGIVIVGAPGVGAYLYQKDEFAEASSRITNKWSIIEEYGPPAGDSPQLSKFGFSVATSPEATAVGAPGFDVGGDQDVGTVYPDTAAPLPAIACGDGRITGDEECDDADTEWKRGQTCRATCTRLSCGDPNDDGKITSADALFALNAAVGNTRCEISVCDVGGNGRLAAGDALSILRKAVASSVTFACPDPSS